MACINFRIGDVGAVDAFLSAPPLWNHLPLRCALQLAGLLAIRGKHRDAIAILYELRRLHADGNVHVRYLQSFLFQGGQNTDWLVHDAAEVGTAVCVEDSAGERQWFILEDRTDPRIEDGEITSAHRIFGELLGKRLGDQILLRQGSVAPGFGKIVELQSKYVRAVQESAQNMQTRFPDIKGFELVRLSPDGNPETGGIELLLSQVAKRSDNVRNMLRIYQDRPLPVTGLAKVLGGSVFDAWGALCRSAPHGVQTCLGSPQERHDALSELSKDVTLVVDLVALMTITQLGLGDLILRCAKRLGVVQATLDLLSGEIVARKAVGREESMTVWKEGDRFVRRTITADEVAAYVQSLQAIVDWVRQHCEVIPIPLEIEGDVDWKRRLLEVLDEASIDTIRTARASGYTLYSDDQRLRALANGEFGIGGIWTQAVLVYGIDKELITRVEYSSAVIALACAGYRHTSVDPQVLMAAAEQAEWRVERPYTQVLEAIGADECDPDSGARVVTDFIHALWNQTIMRGHSVQLAMSVLDAMTTHGEVVEFLSRLQNAVRAKFAFLPIQERQVMRLLESWRQTRIV